MVATFAPVYQMWLFEVEINGLIEESPRNAIASLI